MKYKRIEEGIADWRATGSMPVVPYWLALKAEVLHARLTALAKPRLLLGRDSGFIGSRVEETEARINRKYRNSRRSL
jgi:hypothetical protein